MTCRRPRLAGNVVRIGETNNAYRIIMWKSVGKCSIGIPIKIEE
jgi:hypothetical protein